MADTKEQYSGRFSREFLNDLTQRLDGPTFIRQFVNIKQAGDRFLGLCPFHKDSKPSFYVRQDGSFHCFGCGKNGSVFSFLMEKNLLRFPEAVAEVANYLGVALPKSRSRPALTQEQKDLFDTLEKAAEIFESQLKNSTPNSPISQYIAERGLDQASLDKFRVGFAQDGWTGLKDRLGSVGEELLIKADLLVKNRQKNSVYDRFRNRLTFPIRNRQGNVVGFGGRALGDTDPKYLNSSQTPVFEKNRELYGLFEALQVNRRPKRLLLVEGYMDVIALSQFGIDYAVAVLGTSPNPNHFRTMFWFTDEVVVCFDGDAAGRTAANRALNNTLEHLSSEHAIRFMFLPEDEDPDSLVRKQGPKAFEQLIDQSQYVADYFVDYLLSDKQETLKSIESKAKFINQAVSLIRKVKQESMRLVLVHQVEQAFSGEILIGDLVKQRIESHIDDRYPPPPPPETAYEDVGEREDSPDSRPHFFLNELAVRARVGGLLCSPHIWSEIAIERELLVQLHQYEPEHPLTRVWSAIDSHTLSTPASVIAFFQDDDEFAQYLQSVYNEGSALGSASAEDGLQQFVNSVRSLLTSRKSVVERVTHIERLKQKQAQEKS